LGSGIHPAGSSRAGIRDRLTKCWLPELQEWMVCAYLRTWRFCGKKICVRAAWHNLTS